MNKLASTLKNDDYVFRVRGYASQMSRDYTYAEDVAKAFVLAAKFLDNQQESSFDIVDICNGKPYTLKQAIDVLEDEFDAPLRYLEYDMPADWEPAATCGDPTAARELLGWKPEVCFNDGMHNFAEWWKETNA